MFIFIRLLLAHFIGDFPLQFNGIYSLKRKGLLGVVPHAALIGLALVILSWPYLNNRYLWRFIGFICLSHLIQDWIKVNMIKPMGNFWLYTLDQILHVAAISVVFFTPLSLCKPPVPHGNGIILLYNNDLLFIYLTAVLIVTYNGLYMLMAYYKTFLGRIVEYRSFEKYFGMIERAGILVLVPFFYFPLILAGFLLLRLAVFSILRNRGSVSKHFISPLEISLGWTLASVTGFVCARLLEGYIV